MASFRLRYASKWIDLLSTATALVLLLVLCTLALGKGAAHLLRWASFGLVLAAAAAKLVGILSASANRRSRGRRRRPSTGNPARGIDWVAVRVPEALLMGAGVSACSTTPTRSARPAAGVGPS
jgi:hypothetical protein